MLFGITTGETSKFFLVNSRRLTESDVGQLKRVELIEECIITKIYCMTRQTIVNRNKIHFYVFESSTHFWLVSIFSDRFVLTSWTDDFRNIQEDRPLIAKDF